MLYFPRWNYETLYEAKQCRRGGGEGEDTGHDRLKEGMPETKAFAKELIEKPPKQRLLATGPGCCGCFAGGRQRKADAPGFSLWAGQLSKNYK